MAIEETRKAFMRLKTIYTAAGVPGNVVLYEGNGGHKYYKEGSWPFINKYFWLPAFFYVRAFVALRPPAGGSHTASPFLYGAVTNKFS
jgi:hypothetical protein